MGTRGIIVFLMIIGGLLIAPSFASASNYSAGLYGDCQYNTCGISLSSSSTVTLNVTPGSSAVCTVAADELMVDTSSNSGYTITISDSDTTTAMTNGTGGSIPTVSGTAASPVTLTANTWGYRVDETSGGRPRPGGRERRNAGQRARLRGPRGLLAGRHRRE